MTRARVLTEMLEPGRKHRDTADCDTPAICATSYEVGVADAGIWVAPWLDLPSRLVITNDCQVLRHFARVFGVSRPRSTQFAKWTVPLSVPGERAEWSEWRPARQSTPVLDDQKSSAEHAKVARGTTGGVSAVCGKL